MSCFGPRTPVENWPACGVLNKDDTLTKEAATVQPGEFVQRVMPGMETCYSLLSTAASLYSKADAVGTRPVISRTVVDGFEKLTLGPYEYTSYAAYFRRIEALGSGLQPHMPAGDNCIIYAGTQLEWMMSAFACWRCGGTVGTVYDTLGEDAARFAINQSRAKVVISDAKLLKPLSKIASDLKYVKLVVTLADDAADSNAAAVLKERGIEVKKLSELEAAGLARPMPAQPLKPSDVAVLMYTSGTTGNPKGVLISHANISATIGGATTKTSALGPYLRPGERFLAYLPLAHIMELVIELAALSQGMVIGYGGVRHLVPVSQYIAPSNPVVSPLLA